MAESKVHMDGNFERRLRELKDHAAQEASARRLGGQVPWSRPAGYAGDASAADAMGVPFSRAQANAEYLTAVADHADPGTTGDVIAATTMIDVLAVLERAFRTRQTLRRPRATALMLGRLRGHGHDRGPLVQCYLVYVRELLKQARAGHEPSLGN